VESKIIEFFILWFFYDLLWFFSDSDEINIKERKKEKTLRETALDVKWPVLGGGIISGFRVEEGKSDFCKSWGTQSMDQIHQVSRLPYFSVHYLLFNFFSSTVQ